MSSNKQRVGNTYPATDKPYTRELIEAYARATGDDNPRYFGASAVAPPIAVVAASIPHGVLPPLMDRDFFGDPARLLKLLHAEEDITWQRVIGAGDVLSTVGRIEAVEDKSSGELVVIGTRLTNQRGELVAETRSRLMIRDKRVATLRAIKEEMSRVEEPPAPLFAVEWTVAPDQSERYAAVSGDHNPIHLDDEVARKAGLKGRILHGLCTMAFAQRAVIDRAASGDPARLVRLKARFTKPVYMQDTLTCVGWEIDSTAAGKVYGLLVRNQDGVVVIREGLAEIAS